MSALVPGTQCRVCESPHASVVQAKIRDWEFGAGDEYEYRRCGSCGVVQLHPFPTIADLLEAYPDHYVAFQDKETSHGLVYKALWRLSAAALKRMLRPYIPDGARVLDVGCGNGGFLERLRPLGATTLDGIDFSDRACALAEKKGITTFCGTFEDFDGEPDAYDAVFMNHYIEHVMHPHVELATALRLLKPGGWIIGELPNYRSLDRWLFGRYWGGNHVPRHTFQYDPKTLGDLLTRTGYEDVTFGQQVNPGHLVLSLQNWWYRDVDPKTNDRLTHGRMKSFGALLALTAPFHAIQALCGASGMIRFRARKPQPESPPTK